MHAHSHDMILITGRPGGMGLQGVALEETDGASSLVAGKSLKQLRHASALWNASIAMDVCILHFAAGTSVITDQSKMAIYPQNNFTYEYACTCLQVRGNTALHMMTTFFFFCPFQPHV